MSAEFKPQELSRSIPLVSLEAIELEEAVLGAILLDPNALAAIEELTIQAFSISSHQQIFRVMRELHNSSLKPDLATVAFRLSEKGILKQIGGKSKLASLLDRMVHSYSVKQHAALLQEKYTRRYLKDSFSQIAQLAQTEPDLSQAITQAQAQLNKIHTVTRDSISNCDTGKLDIPDLSTTVTGVTQILSLGLPEWEEQAHLDKLQLVSGISKSSFAHLVASARCASDEVMPSDWQQISRFIDWKNATLDFNQVLPDMADDFLHDGRILNIDPVMLGSIFSLQPCH
jgi:hypothetical protein